MKFAVLDSAILPYLTLLYKKAVYPACTLIALTLTKVYSRGKQFAPLSYFVLSITGNSIRSQNTKLDRQRTLSPLSYQLCNSFHSNWGWRTTNTTHILIYVYYNQSIWLQDICHQGPAGIESE